MVDVPTYDDNQLSTLQSIMLSLAKNHGHRALPMIPGDGARRKANIINAIEKYEEFLSSAHDLSHYKRQTQIAVDRELNRCNREARHPRLERILVAIDGFKPRAGESSNFDPLRMRINNDVGSARMAVINLHYNPLIGVENARDFLAEEGIGYIRKEVGDMPIDVVGYSMGGIVGSYLAGETKGKLALIGTPTKGLPWMKRLRRFISGYPGTKSFTDLAPDSDAMKGLADIILEDEAEKVLVVGSKNDRIVTLKQLYESEHEGVERYLVENDHFTYMGNRRLLRKLSGEFFHLNGVETEFAPPSSIETSMPAESQDFLYRGQPVQ